MCVALLSWATDTGSGCNCETVKILSGVGFTGSVTGGMALVTVTIHLDWRALCGIKLDGVVVP